MYVCLLLSRMELTPEQVFQDIDGLSQAMTGLGKGTQQEDSSAPRPLAPSPEAIQGGEQRGASFAQQREQKGASCAPQSEQRGASFAPQSSGVKDYEYSSNDFVLMRTGADRETVIPSTSVRKNITTHRPRGRLDEPRNPREVKMKRPKGRSKDRAYRRESMGSLPSAGASHRESTLPSSRMKVGGPPLPGPELLRRCKARMREEMAYRTNAPKSHGYGTCVHSCATFGGGFPSIIGGGFPSISNPCTSTYEGSIP
jgi:hypothetical protein